MVYRLLKSNLQVSLFIADRYMAMVLFSLTCAFFILLTADSGLCFLLISSRFLGQRLLTVVYVVTLTLFYVLPSSSLLMKVISKAHISFFPQSMSVAI
jgi:hypothetical protein